MAGRFWYGSERGAHWRSPVDSSWLIALGYQSPFPGVVQHLPRKDLLGATVGHRAVKPRCLWCLHTDTERTTARLVGVPLNTREGGWPDIVATYADHGIVAEAEWKQLITPKLYESVSTLPAFRWMRVYLPSAATIRMESLERDGQVGLFGGGA